MVVFIGDIPSLIAGSGNQRHAFVHCVIHRRLKRGGTGLAAQSEGHIHDVRVALVHRPVNRGNDIRELAVGVRVERPHRHDTYGQRIGKTRDTDRIVRLGGNQARHHCAV